MPPQVHQPAHGPPHRYAYYYAPPPVRRRGGGLIWLVLTLGCFAVIGVVGTLFSEFISAAETAAQPGTSSSQPQGGEAQQPGSSATVTRNRLYKAGALNGFGCTGRQITEGQPQSFKVFLDSTSDCLDRSWAKALDDAGLRFQEPERVYWSQPGRSPCGDYPAKGAAAFYCPINQGIYIGVVHVQQAAGGLPVDYNVAYARNLAHEYGHHVQNLSGILEHVHRERSRAASEEASNAITRRNELQAQCLAGVFMAGVRQSFPVTVDQWRIALRDSYGRGDDPSDPSSRTHGTRDHYRGWLNRGFQRGSLQACNTWSQPDNTVS